LTIFGSIKIQENSRKPPLIEGAQQPTHSPKQTVSIASKKMEKLSEVGDFANTISSHPLKLDSYSATHFGGGEPGFSLL